MRIPQSNNKYSRKFTIYKIEETIIFHNEYIIVASLFVYIVLKVKYPHAIAILVGNL